MKVVILTEYYPPEIGASQNRLSALAQALKRSGHSVTVLAATPMNYAGESASRSTGGNNELPQ
jgi:hypothetical protein